ncbi:MAG: DUF4433 domain-containing protein [Candidatus Kapabacteria bacterium]|jgi:hypothetical protein|nr:DUF4433 domain-containing protein [Candidatus Kapabacteria bacterium]
MIDLSKIGLYRITHRDNLEHIFKIEKLTAPNHPKANQSYIGIGDGTLISTRGKRTIVVEPSGSVAGSFQEYVSFYFGTRSPMLYQIWRGGENVLAQPQRDIVYLVSSVEKVRESGQGFVFSDGHGIHRLTKFYDNLENLTEVDFEMVKEQHWSDTVTDSDRKRRKQAEFLVKSELGVEYLLGIGVFDEETRIFADSLATKYGSRLPAKVYRNWYY